MITYETKLKDLPTQVYNGLDNNIILNIKLNIDRVLFVSHESYPLAEQALQDYTVSEYLDTFESVTGDTANQSYLASYMTIE